MKKAIANVSIVPMRAENSDKAEMVSQILFGESMSIIETNKNWTKIKLDFDGYEGWVDTKQISPITEESLLRRKTCVVNLLYSCYDNQLISIGSEVESNEEEKVIENPRDEITKAAIGFINTPYLWGGRSFFGIDCSGFTQIVYKTVGIKIPRDAFQQAEMGEVLDFIEEALPGDLAFFENEEGKIIHVGIMLENNNIIHAHGKVRIDTLDSIGIFNKDQNKHTHKLRFIKTLVSKD
ncbi:C40 family peptidase [Riemerella columbipharyngis]|uniref:SH3 domain-containing protein n=1 Tax=Riemerella columbipharyngis TaxID=1071918 RepID=A0A1G7B2Q1_9FLAO|nr:C40 family peptidase [Riemerella columbipharyngis]SDE21301.1 SH3 domain-containing protein [Riemerella columbipharyngis]